MSERRLLILLSEAINRSGYAAATSMVTLEATENLVADVTILREQLSSALGLSRRPDATVALAAAQKLVPKSGRLELAVLRKLHLALLGDSFDYAGQLRTVHLRVGNALAPVAPEDVETELKRVASDWNAAVVRLPGMKHAECLRELAALHHSLLRVHPFFDGNGLVAITLLRLQLSQYLGLRLGSDFSGTAHAAALAAAEAGDLDPLITHISAHSAPIGQMRGVNSTPKCATGAWDQA